MATRLGWLREAFARATHMMTSSGEALVHWLRRNSTEATSLWTSTFEAFRHWLKGISTDDVIVGAETEVEIENLGTDQIPIDLPRINTKHDLVVFDYVGP